MRKSIILAFVSILFLTPLLGSQKVMVIHGYGVHKSIMNKIDKNLQKAHFITENYAYNSITVDLDSLGKSLYLYLKSSGYDTVSFVTHSMGGLVVRSMMQYSINDPDFPIVFRIVMITPPNHGAEIADFYTSFKILKKLIGPNVYHMKTTSDSYANKLPIPVKSEVGVIVGYRGKDIGFNPFIKGDNDGLLTPARTKLGIEKDIAFKKFDHGTITQNKNVISLIINFLQKGTFILN